MRPLPRRKVLAMLAQVALINSALRVVWAVLWWLGEMVVAYPDMYYFFGLSCSMVLMIRSFCHPPDKTDTHVVHSIWRRSLCVRVWVRTTLLDSVSPGRTEAARELKMEWLVYS
jgi:hypothetical protein